MVDDLVAVKFRPSTLHSLGAVDAEKTGTELGLDRQLLCLNLIWCVKYL